MKKTNLNNLIIKEKKIQMINKKKNIKVEDKKENKYNKICKYEP